MALLALASMLRLEVMHRQAKRPGAVEAVAVAQVQVALVETAETADYMVAAPVEARPQLMGIIQGQAAMAGTAF
jgi:hypothetical protein